MGGGAGWQGVSWLQRGGPDNQIQGSIRSPHSELIYLQGVLKALHPITLLQSMSDMSDKVLISERARFSHCGESVLCDPCRSFLRQEAAFGLYQGFSRSPAALFVLYLCSICTWKGLNIIHLHKKKSGSHHC